MGSLDFIYVGIFLALLSFWGVRWALVWARTGRIEQLGSDVRGKSPDQAVKLVVEGDPRVAEAVLNPTGTKIRDDIRDVTGEDFLVADPWGKVAMDQAPPTFTAIGILFTFIGLVMGVRALNLTGSAADLSQGVGNLVNGLGTAFYSSIFGIVLSVTSTIANRWCLAKLDVSSARLVTWLVPHAKNIDHHIEQNLRELIEVQKEQSSAMRTLASDLPAKISEAMSPQFQSVANAVDQLGANSLDLHQRLLETMLSNFLEGFQNVLGAKFGELAEVLRLTVAWHKAAQDQFSSISKQLSESLGMQQNINGEQASILAQQRAFLAAFQSATEEIENALTATMAQLGPLMTEWTEVEKRITQHRAQLSEAARAQGEALGLANRALSDSALSVGNSIDQLREILQRMQAQYVALSAMQAQTEKDLQTKMSLAFTELDTQVATVVDRFSGTLQMTGQQLKLLDETLVRMSQVTR